MLYYYIKLYNWDFFINEIKFVMSLPMARLISRRCGIATFCNFEFFHSVNTCLAHHQRDTACVIIDLKFHALLLILLSQTQLNFRVNIFF